MSKSITEGDNAPDQTRDIPALVAPLALPAVHVVTTDAPSRSHFGGMPNLPEGVKWPERAGSPLGFLARISLTELQSVQPIPWLPVEGALLFFYDLNDHPWGFDPADRGGSAVLLVPDLRSPDLTGMDQETCETAVPHRFIGFSAIEVLPSQERESVERLQLNDEEFDWYDELRYELFKDKPAHQIGGYPRPVQNDDMELECQLASNGVYCDTSGHESARAKELASGAENWRLLFQFDSDEEMDVIWVDFGKIYFWVEESRARAGDFSNIWTCLQST